MTTWFSTCNICGDQYQGTRFPLHLSCSLCATRWSAWNKTDITKMCSCRRRSLIKLACNCNHIRAHAGTLPHPNEHTLKRLLSEESISLECTEYNIAQRARVLFLTARMRTINITQNSFTCWPRQRDSKCQSEKECHFVLQMSLILNGDISTKQNLQYDMPVVSSSDGV